MDNTIYESHKRVKREPMNRLAYNRYRGWALPLDEDGSDEGYLIEYLDGGKPNDDRHEGYISWSPKEQFDNGYTEVVALDFFGRLVKEHEELAEKYTKLYAFLHSAAGDLVSDANSILLSQQLEIMQKYISVLKVRIELISK